MEFEAKYTILGNDRGFKDEADLVDYYQAVVGDLLNDNMQWDMFIRGDNGKFYVLGIDIKVAELGAMETRVIAEMDHQGIIPKGSAPTKAYWLEQYYEANQEVLMAESAIHGAESESEVSAAESAFDLAMERRIEAAGKLQEIALAREANNKPTNDDDMRRTAETLESLGANIER